MDRALVCATIGRPDERVLQTLRRHASSISGHTLMAFTGAALVCAHHTHLPLYGGGFADIAGCGPGLTRATVQAMTRVTADRHHLSDVMVGSALGFGFGYALAMLLHYGKSPARRWRRRSFPTRPERRPACSRWDSSDDGPLHPLRSRPAHQHQFWAAALDAQPTLDVPGMTEFTLGPSAVLGLMPGAGIKRLLPGIADPDTAHDVPRAEIYLVVLHAEACHARALSAGARELSPLEDRSWGHRVAYCLDPDGHVLAFAEPIAR